MVRPALRHGGRVLAGLVTLFVIVLAGGAWRVGKGPVALDTARPAVERLLALQAPGGRAHIAHASLVWFPSAKALGLRLEGVRLSDTHGRDVLVARRLEVAGAASSLVLLHPALAHVAAEDFFAAVSVSPQGRYQLGYEASGQPTGGSDLSRILFDLTGRVRADRPLSYLRVAEFSGGHIALRQVGGPVAWTGEIHRASFTKLGGRVSAGADLAIGQGPDQARLVAWSRGAVGLGEAVAHAQLQGIVPSRIFPTVSATKPLSAWDAPVSGRADVSYAARSGVKAADIDLVSGAGRLRLGQSFAPLHGAAMRAHYDPAVQQVVLDGLRIDSTLNAFDLTGAARLQPERARAPATLLWTLASAGGRVALAEVREPAQFSAFSASGRLVPALHRLDISTARAKVDGGVATAAGAITGGRPGRSVKVDLDGGVAGEVSSRAILAVWPRRLSASARDWVSQHVQDGRAGQASYSLRLPSRPNGDQHRLPSGAIHAVFSIAGGKVWLGPGFDLIEDIGGQALIQGDHLDLTSGGGRIRGVTLTRASVEITHFKGGDQFLKTRLRASGDARSMLQAIDAPGDHLLTKGGFDPARVTATGDVDAEITRPLAEGQPEPPLEDYDIRYRGLFRQASLSDAVLGQALKATTATVDGSGHEVRIKAAAVVGAYRGAVDYTAELDSRQAGRSVAMATGVIDASLIGMGGPVSAPMPFSGQFEMQGGAGQGRMRSKGFTGEIAWTDGLKAHTELKGELNADALRAAGLPVSKALDARTPARLVMVRNGAAWTGQLDADVYSGAITFVPGPRSRLRYVAQLTPVEARRLGLGDDPAFRRTQPLVIDIAAGQSDGSGSYALGPMTGQVGWSEEANGQRLYRWRATLTDSNLHMMGLPVAMKPKAPAAVDVAMSSNHGVMSGTAAIAGTQLRFTAVSQAGGSRRVELNGPVLASTLEALGAAPPGAMKGQAQVAANLAWGPQGLSGAEVKADLTNAAFKAPDGLWSKSAGQAFVAAATLVRRSDGGFDAPHFKAWGAGAQAEGSASWRPDGSVIRASSLKLANTYDGSLEVSQSAAGGQAILARARFIDARKAFDHSGQDEQAGPAPERQVDLQAAEMRVSDKLTLRQVKIAGSWGAPAHRKLDLSAVANAGGAMTLSIYPDSQGSAISGRIQSVSDAAQTFFDLVAFKGGDAAVSGHLVEGGADLDIVMHNVRLTHAPMLAQVLTMGSLQGMANTLNGQGIYFSHVVAPVKLRGSRLFIGASRATGSALGLTTTGVIDMQRRTVDLNGAIAPAYGLNALAGKLPLVGGLLVSKKGEGVFGVTYQARGDFQDPKIFVNPLSLATPGFLRRMFEGRSEAAPATGAVATGR